VLPLNHTGKNGLENMLPKLEVGFDVLTHMVRVPTVGVGTDVVSVFEPLNENTLPRVASVTTDAEPELVMAYVVENPVPAVVEVGMAPVLLMRIKYAPGAVAPAAAEAGVAAIVDNVENINIPNAL
jgi:hypothetical protein